MGDHGGGAWWGIMVGDHGGGDHAGSDFPLQSLSWWPHDPAIELAWTGHLMLAGEDVGRRRPQLLVLLVDLSCWTFVSGLLIVDFC